MLIEWRDFICACMIIIAFLFLQDALDLSHGAWVLLALGSPGYHLSVILNCQAWTNSLTYKRTAVYTDTLRSLAIVPRWDELNVCLFAYTMINCTGHVERRIRWFGRGRYWVEIKSTTSASQRSALCGNWPSQSPERHPRGVVGDEKGN